MQDRVPTKPNRVLIRPEDGSPSFYATMTRADEPTQVGDPLNKSTFLKDETAALFGLGKGAVPDDVFSLIPSKIQDIKDEVLSIPRTVISIGTYTGNGDYTFTDVTGNLVGTKKSLTLPFVPKLLVVSLSNRNLSSGMPADAIMLWQDGISSEYVSSPSAGASRSRNYTVSGNTITWWLTTPGVTAQDQSNYPSLMFNANGVKYTYFAVGVLEVE